MQLKLWLFIISALVVLGHPLDKPEDERDGFLGDDRAEERGEWRVESGEWRVESGERSALGE